MSSSDLLFLISSVVSYGSLLALVYAAYWAFYIGRSLSAPLYRNQALGLGVFSLVIMIAALPSPLPGSSGILGNIWFQLAYTLVTAVFWLGTVYFVDASALASRRSDPLLRDTLHWSEVRYVVWGVQISIVCFILLGTAYSAVTGNYTLSDQIAAGNNGAASSLPAIITDLAWALAFGVIAMFVPIALRARSPTLRRHFRWLAILGAVTGAFFAGSVVTSSIATPDENLVLSGVYFVVVGYCLYKSAKSLVPLNRMTRVGLDAPYSPDAAKV
jgi:hypothetical protein